MLRTVHGNRFRLPLMKLDIRTSVLFLALAPATLIAVVLAIYLTTTRLQDLEQALKERGQAIANQLALAAEYPMLADDGHMLHNLALAALQEADVAAVTIQDSRDETLVALRQAVLDFAKPNAAPLPFVASIRCVDRHYNTPPADSCDPATSPTLGQVRLELSRANLLNRQQEVIGASLLLIALCLLVATGLGCVIGRWVTEPLLKLANAVRESHNGLLHPPEHGYSRGELGELERNVHIMAATQHDTQQRLQEQIDEATAELRQTLEELEIKNVEIDIARKKALQASRVKSEFLAKMSHEIRTPMNGVLGFIDLLAKTPLTQTQQSYLRTLRASAENLMFMLNDILDFSKLEAGKLRLRQRDFNLRETLENAVLLFAPNAQHKGLDLILDIAPDTPSELVGDAHRLAQIITNLISNAVKFTDQGEVAIVVAKTHETATQITLNIDVRDTGIGIAESYQKRLFNAFDQLDTSTTRRYSGTGLGLAICQRLVAMMDGDISVDSQRGVGTTFHVALNLTKSTSSAAALPHPAGSAVLVAADALLARAVVHILEYCHMDCRWQSDWISAEPLLAKAAKSAPRFLIIDQDSMTLADDALPAPLSANPQLSDWHLIVLGINENNPVIERWSQWFPTLQFVNKPPTLRELLPLLQAAPAVAVPAEQPEADTAAEFPLRVLLADDNLINRQLARIFLNQLGVSVDEASDGNEALDLCRQIRYDLILMDLHMPMMDGFEVTQRLRTRPNNPNRNTPIVALTADVLSQTRSQSEAAGVNDYLIKPIDKNTLRKMLEKWRPRQDAPRLLDATENV